MLTRFSKYLGLVLALFIVFSGLVYNGAAAAGEAAVGIKQAVELAQEKNIQLALAELELDNARLDYQKNQLNNLAAASRLVELQGELAMVNARESYRQARNGIIIDIISQYLQLVQLDREIVIARNEAELKQRELQETEAQVEVGYKGSLELFNQQREYQSALNNLEKVEDDFQQQLKTLRVSISLDENTPISIPDLGEPEVWEIDEKGSIRAALASDASLDLRERQIELAAANLKRAEVVDTPDLEMTRLANNLEMARLNSTLAAQNLETSVQKKYYLFKQAVKGLDIARRAEEQAAENLKIITRQEAAGLVTKNDLLEARVNLLRAEKGQLTAIINYHLNELQLKQAMGLELGVNINVQEGK